MTSNGHDGYLPSGLCLPVKMEKGNTLPIIPNSEPISSIINHHNQLDARYLHALASNYPEQAEAKNTEKNAENVSNDSDDSDESSMAELFGDDESDEQNVNRPDENEQAMDMEEIDRASIKRSHQQLDSLSRISNGAIPGHLRINGFIADGL